MRNLIGIICLCLRDKVKSLAAEFCIRWSLLINLRNRQTIYRTGFPTFLTHDPMSGYWRFNDPQGLIFTMIKMIILRFGLLLVVFYDDFLFPYMEKKFILILTFAFATPFLSAHDPSRPPGWETLKEVVAFFYLFIYLCFLYWGLQMLQCRCTAFQAGPHLEAFRLHLQFTCIGPSDMWWKHGQVLL